MRLDYDEINPFTRRKTVLVEWDENAQQNMKLCMETGYHTFDSWVCDGGTISPELEAYRENLPDVISNFELIEFEGGNWSKLAWPHGICQVWYLIVMQSREHVLYPEYNDDRFDYIWKVCSWRLLSEGEEIDDDCPKYEYEGKTAILGPETVSIFQSSEFEDATIEFHRRCSEIYNTDEN